MFGLGKPKCRVCHRRRDRCICHTCNCGATGGNSQSTPAPAPSPMRIEYLQPLVITQPEFSRRRENVSDEPQEQPATPKDAPVPMTYNEWFEFDDSWQEGPDIEDTNA